jgi:hypothetical protein
VEHSALQQEFNLRFGNLGVVRERSLELKSDNIVSLFGDY